jgi:transposase
MVTQLHGGGGQRATGRRSADAVSKVVWRFNQEGLAAIEVRHRGGPTPIYTAQERERILKEARRKPTGRTGAPPGRFLRYRELCAEPRTDFPEVSTYTTIWKVVLKEAGFEWQRTRSWCETGRVERKRKESGEVVEVIDPGYRS